MGFTPHRGKRPIEEVKSVLRSSIAHGLGNPPVRWIMLEGAVHRRRDGLRVLRDAAVPAASCTAIRTRMPSPDSPPRSSPARRSPAACSCPTSAACSRRRTSVLLCGTALSTAVLAAIGLIPQFWVAVTLLVFWGLMFSAITPVRQAYLNGLIAARERATVLSFDSLLASSGAVVDPARARQGGRRVGLSRVLHRAAPRSRRWRFRSSGWPAASARPPMRRTRQRKRRPRRRPRRPRNPRPNIPPNPAARRRRTIASARSTRSCAGTAPR